MTTQQVYKLLAILSAAYPSYQLQEESLRIYAAMLRDLEYDAAQQAAVRHIATSKFFPTIAEFREAAQKVCSPLPEPEEAWEEVMRQVREIGSYGRPEFSHEIINRAVATVGWMNICLSEAPGVERGHFLRVYETFLRRERETSNLKVLQEKLPNLQQIGEVSKDGKVIAYHRAISNGYRDRH